jgi:hypothetical protein
VAGVRYTVEGEVTPCGNGLHASVNPLDALRYGAPHYRLKRVLLEGAVPHGSPVDKHAGRARTVLFEIMPEQAEPVLREFACWCVETVARPAAVSALRKAGLEAEAVKLEALPPVVDKASAEAFRDAADAAYDAYDAARAAARAAYDAAYAARAAYAAYDAAYAAARAAADAAAYAARAAYAAAYAAARAAYAAYDAAYAAYADMGEELARRLLHLAPEGYTEK